MTPEQMEKINEVFESARDLPPEEREPYLDSVCDGDEVLKTEVQLLIAADERNIEDQVVDAEQLKHKSLLSFHREGRFKIVRPIGRGGSGRVYLANDTALNNKEVVFKFLTGSGEEQVKRFKQEALAAVAVKHPNIIDVTDLVIEGPIPFIVTEYVKGGTLREKMAEGRLQVLEALFIAEKVASALEAAHEKGIIHRDIKPENIMVGDVGVVKVLDFGIAKLMRTDSHLVDTEAQTNLLIRTVAGDIFGTLDYMSPEQVNAEEVDARSDIWSLGVVLYEMLTGQVPFHGKTPIATCDAIRQAAPKPLSGLVNGIPDGLQNIIDKALAKESNHRFQRAGDLIDEIRRIERKLSAGRGRSSLPTLPLPDAGLKVPGPPVAMTSFSFRGPAGQKSASFDLGTIWGLDRSSFIGILASHSGDKTYEGLLRTERALWDTMKADEDTKPHPTRWWLHTDMRRNSNGPSSLDEVWESLVDGSDARVHYLNDNGLPDSIIPGLFFNIVADDFDESCLRMILHWCRELIYGKTRLAQLAVVLQVSGARIDESRQVASHLLSELEELSAQVPTEVMVIDFDPSNTELTAEPEVDITQLFGLSTKTQPGHYFCSWIVRAVKSAAREWQDKEEQNRYATVMAKFRLLADPELLNEYDGRGQAQQVIKDVDAVAGDADQEFHCQFLRLIEKYLPSRIRPLIRAYARSDNRVARRASLVFATRSDSLLDNWVESNSLETGHAPEERDLIADPETGPFVEDLILALLRQYRKGQNKNRIKEFIQEHKETLRPDLQDVVELVTAEHSPEMFSSDFSVRKFLLAIRAGAEIKLPIERLLNFDLSEPDSWWLLTALPTSRDRIGRILKLPPKQRAVFGLCSPEEWKVVRSDKEVERQILICRRRRPVKFLHC